MVKIPEFLKRLLRKDKVMKESEETLPKLKYVSDILNEHGPETDINDSNYGRVSVDLYRALWPKGTNPPLTEEQYKEQCKQYIRDQ